MKNTSEILKIMLTGINTTLDHKRKDESMYRQNNLCRQKLPKIKHRERTSIPQRQKYMCNWRPRSGGWDETKIYFKK